MNITTLIGRPTTNPEIRYSQGKDSIAISTFTLAVDNPFKEDSADFIRIKAFGKTAEFADKYIQKGVRIGLQGRIQTGSYEHEDGYTVFTTDIVANNFYFADGKKEDGNNYKDNKRGNSKQGNAKSRR